MLKLHSFLLEWSFFFFPSQGKAFPSFAFIFSGKFKICLIAY